MRNLRVGIIGASAGGGWAKASHIPAVKGLAGLELAAVAATSQESADAAAEAFGAGSAFGDPLAMVRDPGIDVVTVAVKVPAHRELVLAALAAGKHVYCEWPLGRTSAEAEEMAAAARTAEVRAVVGLQTRLNPAARRARDLVSSGAIGRVLSARVTSATAAFGPDVPASMVYAEDPANGVTVVSIHGGHTIDLAVAILGGVAELGALLSTQHPDIRVAGEAVPRQRLIPDHALVQARLARGAPLAIEVAGARPPETPFRLEVIGDEGVLALEGGALRGFQTGRLRVSLDGEAVAVEEGEVASMPEEAANVASVYVSLRDDILNGTRTAPGFDHAVALTRLIEDLSASSRDGLRKPTAGWPED